MSEAKTIPNRRKLLELTELSILAAIIIIMAFTPLGFLKVGLIEITFITIPVVIGAIVLGPVAGGILGGIFGIASFIQCFGMSAFGSALLGINPILTLIICLIPRVLMGFLTGLIFKALSKIDKTKMVSFGAASLSGALLNTIFFVVTLILLFGRTSYIQEMQAGKNVFAFMVAFVGINGLVEALATFVAGTAISKALVAFTSRNTH